MADCSQLPIRLAELTHKIASEDKSVRNLGDVVKRIQSKFPYVTRDQVISDFSKLQGERRVAAQEKASARAGKEIDVAKQIMKEANVEARDQERAKKLIESFQTLKKNPTKTNERKYMNARQEFLAEMVKADRPWVNKLIKNADMEADLARFQKNGITKQEQADLIAKYAPKKRPESKSEAFNKAKNKADRLRNEIEWEIKKAKKTVHAKVWSMVSQPFHAMRNLKLSWDLGHFNRQGGFAQKAHPVMWAKSAVNSFKALDYNLKGAFGSQENFRTFMSQHVENNAWHDRGVSAGLRVKATSQNEFDAGWGEKLANVAPGVSWSNVSYGAFINKLRMDYFAHLAEQLPNPSNADLKSLAEIVNTFTGYSTVGGTGVNEALGLYMLAPADTIAKLKRVIGEPVWGPGKTPAVRKLAAMEYLRYLRGWAGIRALKMIGIGLGFVGADDEEENELSRMTGMEIDPRSSKFMQDKIRHPDGTMEYYDLTSGGAWAPLVAAAKVASMQQKDTDTGRIDEIGASDRFRPLQKWARYKANPMADTIMTLMTGKNAVGQEIGEETIPEAMKPLPGRFDRLDTKEKSEQALKYLGWTNIPLFLQDVREEMNRQGINGAERRTLMNFVGVGSDVVDYK